MWYVPPLLQLRRCFRRKWRVGFLFCFGGLFCLTLNAIRCVVAYSESFELVRGSQQRLQSRQAIVERRTGERLLVECLPDEANYLNEVTRESILVSPSTNALTQFSSQAPRVPKTSRQQGRAEASAANEIEKAYRVSFNSVSRDSSLNALGLHRVRSSQCTFEVGVAKALACAYV